MSWKYRLGQRVEVRYLGEWRRGIVEAQLSGIRTRGFYEIRIFETTHGGGWIAPLVTSPARDIRKPKEGKG